MKCIRLISLLLTATVAIPALAQDDLLGSKRGGGGKKGGGESRERQRKEDPPASSRERGSRDSGRNREEARRQDRNTDEVSRRAGRSGRSNYGSNNNSNGRSRGEDDSRIQSRARRQDNARPVDNGRRSGYYGYDNRWSDDWFGYPHYTFSNNDRCVTSPWYVYPHLPGYVRKDRVSFEINIRWRNWSDDTCHDWKYRDRYDSFDPEYDADNAVRDLTRIYTKRDRRALDRLTDGRYNAVIRGDGCEDYSIGSDDLYDLIYDNAWTTKTRKFEVRDVRINRSGVRVVARHEWTDPWRTTREAYHVYVLEDTRNGYRIREFGVYRHCP